MKKKIISILVAIGAVFAGLTNIYLLFFRSANNQSTTTSPAPSSTSQANSSADEASSSSVGSSALTDGTYTGQVTSTNRGDYQVQITVASGSISDITVLEYPADNETSQMINDQALPTYTSEALDSQSADINQISGATEAFKGFTGSLQDAINQAQV